MKGWRTGAGSTLCAALLACGSPGAPGPAPSERTPAPPVANDCPAVGSPFGNGLFYVQDLNARRVCRAYLEQDECVVAIWDDCTVEVANSQRSWEGRIDPVPGAETRMWMRSHSRGSGQAASSCQGSLELGSEPARALLECQRDDLVAFQMYLERVVDPPAPFGEPLPELSVGVAIIQFITAFEQAGGDRFLAAVSDYPAAEGGGLYLFRAAGSGEFAPVSIPASHAHLQIAQASPNGRLLVVGGSSDLFVVDMQSLSVIGQERLTSDTGDRVAGVVMTGENEAIVGFRRDSRASVELQRYELNPFARTGELVVVSQTQLQALVGGPMGTPLYMFVKEAGEARLIGLDPTSLAKLETIVLPSSDTHSLLLDAAGSTAIYSEFRALGEIDLATPEVRRTFPMPYLEHSAVLGFDPARNWVLAGGVRSQGKLRAVHAIDRATGRPIARALMTNDSPKSIAVLGDRLFAAARSRIYQTRLSPSD